MGNRIPEMIFGTANLEDGAVTTPKIGVEAVTGLKIGSGQIVGDHIQEESIEERHIMPGEIGETALASGGVVEEKIAVGAVTEGKIDDLAVINRHIGGGEISFDKIYIVPWEVSGTVSAGGTVTIVGERGAFFPHLTSAPPKGLFLSPRLGLSSGTNMYFDLQNTVATENDYEIHGEYIQG